MHLFFNYLDISECPVNCKGRLCDHESDHCDVCEDGYYGVKCEDGM